MTAISILAHLHWRDVHFGDVPTWGAAIGTVGAFIYTALLFRRDRDDRISGNARHVAAWIGTKEIEPDQSGMASVGEGLMMAGTYRAIFLRNGGDEPVYDVQIHLLGREGDRIPTPRISIDVLPPQDSRYWIRTEDDEAVRTLEFRDPAGQWWERDGHGVLNRSKHPPNRA